jgi:transcriptional regulator with XRE-family HTH domain
VVDKLKLTDGERLWLWRRRSMLTQSEATRRFRCGRNFYSWMENDKRPVPKHYKIIFQLAPRPYELLALYRRRSGMTVEAIGEDLGVCRVTIFKWERECGERLIAYWYRTAGYPWPPAIGVKL